MTISDIADSLSTLTLSDPEYLLFRPSGDKAHLNEKFGEIPRYLFRVFTPKSRGTTNEFWAKSNDASKMDIFEESDISVASMINRHLNWEVGPDKLVSWTSSLLFVLVYIFNRHASLKDGSAFDKIYLCVIDTTKFAKGVFLRDMDLIDAYCSFDANLMRLKKIRKDWYFGEYLSQGALKIEGKCKIVSAQAMINRGLCDLRQEFREFAQWQPCKSPGWARDVNELRHTLQQTESEDIITGKIQVAFKIAQLFGSPWTLPVAANLVALLPYPKTNDIIVQAFRTNIFYWFVSSALQVLQLINADDDKTNCSPLKTKVMVYGLLEVEKFSNIMRDIFKDFYAQKVKSKSSVAASTYQRVLL